MKLVYRIVIFMFTIKVRRGQAGETRGKHKKRKGETKKTGE